MKEEYITFYLVRHGEAENNTRFILNSLPEIKEYPLTALGREQAETTAQFLSTVSADTLFSSPILRARETAVIISEATGVPLIIDGRLQETGMGIFNGKGQELFLKKYANPQERISPDPNDGVESFVDMRSRLTDFLKEIRTHYRGKVVIVVSHSDPLEQLHGILTQEAPGQSAVGWSPAKGSWTKVLWRCV
ncbi:MAG: histidine phosphatase family protein [Minisyncoccota bacterium]